MKKKKKNKKKVNWRNYTIEFLSVFIAVISAFALNNWNENRRDRKAEQSILAEISNGLEKDIQDIQHNMGGHNIGILACQYWRNIIEGKDVNQDSLEIKYKNLTRDYISIQNTSGYEALKSKGLEIIADEDLRFEIILLYEYDLKVIMKLEEEYSEMQFYDSYFQGINEIVSPYFVFDSSGKISGIMQPLDLSHRDRNTLLTYLRKIETNRLFMLENYSGVEDKIAYIHKKIRDEVN